VSTDEPQMKFLRDAADAIGKSPDTVYRYLRNTTDDQIHREEVAGRTAVDVNALARYAATAKPGRPRKS
jgi:hypothetical protein